MFSATETQGFFERPALTGGFVLLHAVPAALTSHIRWSIENTLKASLNLSWEAQPARPGYQRTELTWTGPAGTAAQLASALRQFSDTHFEITERPTATSSALRIMHTPSLGLCTQPVDAQGNFTVTEDRIRYAFEQAAGDYKALYDQFALALGQAWDEELEPLRYSKKTINIAHIRSEG